MDNKRNDIGNVPKKDQKMALDKLRSLKKENLICTKEHVNS